VAGGGALSCKPGWLRRRHAVVQRCHRGSDELGWRGSVGAAGLREPCLCGHPSRPLCGSCGGRWDLKHSYFKNMAAINRRKKD